MILSGYVLETLIICFWYVLIIKKEIHAKVNDADRILGRIINLIIQHRLIIMNNILFIVNYKQEKKKQIDIIKKCFTNLMLINVWLGYFFVIDPIIMSILTKDKDNVAGVIIFVISIVSVSIRELKEHTQIYIEILEKYINRVVIPLEKCSNIIEIEEDEIVKIQWTIKNKMMILLLTVISIAIFSLFIWGEKYLYQNKRVNIIVVIFAVIFWVTGYSKKWLIKREKRKGVVFVSADYGLIKEEVENICNLLNIHNVEFSEIDEDIDNAYTQLNEDGVWKVVVTSLFITKLRKLLEENKNSERKCVLSIDDVKKIFLVTVVHELGHVFYKDIIFEKRRVLVSNLISLGIVIMAIFLLVMAEKSIFFIIIGSILLLFNWIFGGIMCDKRYWGQIAEFKADRIAVKYVNGGIEAFAYYWGNDERIQKEEKSTNEINKGNFIYKYYKRNLEVEKHPSMKYRRKLMEERNEWKWWEYFGHALVIRKWRREGLGWNGVLKVTRI